MGAAQRKTLEAVMSDPVRTTVRFKDVVSLVESLGGSVEWREGSRGSFWIGDQAMHFHRPHGKEVSAGFIKALRDFLRRANVQEKKNL